MIAVCYKCGETKSSPMGVCSSCGSAPSSHDDRELSHLLTQGCIPRHQLEAAANRLRSGKRISLSSGVGTEVFGSKKRAINGKARNYTAIKWAAVGLGVLAFILIFHPWPNFQWASSQNEVSAYEGFVVRFPSSDYVDTAKDRIRLLKDDEVWKDATEPRDIKKLRKYRRVYPDGKHAYQVNIVIEEIADEEWELASSTIEKSTVRWFLKQYPETSKRKEALARIVEIADLNWRRVATTESKEVILQFLKDNPETTRRAEAKRRIREIADQKWYKISKTRSKYLILKYLRDNPETSRKSFAMARISELQDDWEWVREQDTIEDYQVFSKRFPNHRNIGWINKRIIDLEVKAIASGKHGKLPPAQPVRRGGTYVKVTIENKTQYTLTVRYSGPSSRKIVIIAGDTRSLSLSPGEYGVAASVSAANVTNYYGRNTMSAGTYSSNFYIQTRFGQ